MSPFTFQYVSIISALVLFFILFFRNLHSNMFLLFRLSFQRTKKQRNNIYIPICFYYFELSFGELRTPIFIYIPICFYYFSTLKSRHMLRIFIYIPICFYYFKEKKWLNASIYNLHSNMFLLFLL